MNSTGLYLHFPFCRRACHYCHFYRLVRCKSKVNSYLRALALEASLRMNQEQPLATVYLGGGSPSLLEAEELADIVELLSRYFQPVPDTEFTLESNPEDLRPEKLAAWLELGVNRLSLGIQSFQENSLRYLGRGHDGAAARRALDLVASSTLPTYSIDLICGLPGQTEAELLADLEEISSLQVPHLSLYILERVPGIQAKSDRAAGLYYLAREYLLAAGFTHYELSNFCRPGHECRHNLRYWRNLSYIGLGPAAAGYLGGKDYCNDPDLKSYCDSLARGRFPKNRSSLIPEKKRMLIAGLRLLQGLPADCFTGREAEMEFLLAEGFLRRRENGFIAVPGERILLLNEILQRLI